MRRLYLVVGAAFLSSLISTSRVQAQKPNIPPDIQAILDKKKRHEALTMDDIRKLQDWAAGVQAHLPTPPLPPGTPGAPPASADAAPIPVRFELTAHYTRTSSSGTETFDVSESAPLSLTAKINGTADYVKGMLDPSAKISSFLFQPASGSGAGHYHVHATQTRGSMDFESPLSSVTGGMMLVTVGGDTLGIIPGQLIGAVDSTYHDVEDGKPVTKAHKGAVRESLVELLFPWEAHVTKDRTKPTTHPRAMISYNALVAAIQRGKQTPLKVSETFDWNDHGEKVMGTVELTMTIKPSPAPRIEARIEPVTDWDSWIPEGPTPKHEHGNTFQVHVVLYDGETNKPWTGPAKVESVTFALDQVSHLPGVCTNWPAKSDAAYEEKPDLFFATSNERGKTKDVDRQKWELGPAEWTKPVDIESRDFAASGQLTAQVKLAGAPPIDAKFERLQTNYLPIPRDDDHNHISDAWKPGLDLDADADDEDTPAFRDKGDGLTVMEEYRGFLVTPGRKRIPADDEDQRRLDPKVRELLVFLEVDRGKQESLVAKGVQIFESASQVKVFALAEQPRGRKYPGDYGRPRAIVFNPSPAGGQNAAKSTDALGVWITSNMLVPDSVARAWPNHDYHSPPGTDYCSDHPLDCVHDPGTLRYVAIGSVESLRDTINQMMSLVDPDATGGGEITEAKRKLVGEYLRKAGVTEAQRRAAVAAGKANLPRLMDEMATFAIAHELSHSLGAQHHGTFDNNPGISESDGPENCPMRYWHMLNDDTVELYDQKTNKKIKDLFRKFNVPPANTKLWMRFFTGDWNPAASGPSGPWTICGSNMSQMGYRQ